MGREEGGEGVEGVGRLVGSRAGVGIHVRQCWML